MLSDFAERGYYTTFRAYHAIAKTLPQGAVKSLGVASQIPDDHCLKEKSKRVKVVHEIIRPNAERGNRNRRIGEITRVARLTQSPFG